MRAAFINIKVEYGAVSVRINERNKDGTFQLRKIGSIYFEVPCSEKTAAFVRAVPEILEQLPEDVEHVHFIGTNQLFNKSARLQQRLEGSPAQLRIRRLKPGLPWLRWELTELINDAIKRKSTVWSDISAWGDWT
ncbi:hypothetical protein [Bacillus piscicola]|uniref:hypothetical protein n=1 Tax=Bacillus piscicola TaxID=1632684 RepID=UPI001F09F025|nr:hypothetical protein [Bacillus piscicola]